ncbi:MAG: hypothetical protein RBU27_06910 [Bacteroidota bacterium]|jgi:hypothetical protein|nr:hypothetical protein [Bacteroidota bacterium]
MDIPFSFFQQTYPLNPSATLSFTLERAQEITLRIYNTYGQVVHTLYEHAMMKPGHHELRLYGETFPSGGCYARLQTEHGVVQRPLIMTTELR